jgi:hypothetical protein
MTESEQSSLPASFASLPPAAEWLERAAAEIIRGRHLILHGNVRDKVRWRNRYVGVREALGDLLVTCGYPVIGFYDQVDGITVPDDPSLQRFAQLSGEEPSAGPGNLAEGNAPNVEQPVDARTPADAGQPARTGPSAGNRRRVADAEANMTAALSRAAPPTFQNPLDAATAIRRALAQRREAAAFVVDFADLLLLDPGHHDRSDRQQLAVTKKAMLEASQVGALHNALILIASDLAAVPDWLYRGDPRIQTLEVPQPTQQERADYLARVADRFHDSTAIDPPTAAAGIRVLANVTDGMTLSELDGLYRTSRFERLSLTEPRELLSRTVFGRRASPWTALRDRVPGARQALGARVLGQPAAVERVRRTLAAATFGIDFIADPYSQEARPKGVFFFVGPTGVGKTEMARALSEFIFDDESALLRFDMSSFSEPHNAERFYGAPPGYVGYERGGELTNRMHERPFSVLLFDEIEKAHELVFDKFLQILEDGRLTDGLGRTAYFSQSLIIFTSNIGADAIYEQTVGDADLSYEQVAQHFEQAVRTYFTSKLRRPELLGRIGNGIVAFDTLRPEHVSGITQKLLGQLVGTARRSGVELVIDDDAVLRLAQRAMTQPASRALGGRMVKNVLDHAVREPLIDALTNGPQTGRFHVTAPPDSLICTVTRITGCSPQLSQQVSEVLEVCAEPGQSGEE